jgi:hypothetical protein
MKEAAITESVTASRAGKESNARRKHASTTALAMGYVRIINASARRIISE